MVDLFENRTPHCCRGRAHRVREIAESLTRTHEESTRTQSVKREKGNSLSRLGNEGYFFRLS